MTLSIWDTAHIGRLHWLPHALVYHSETAGIFSGLILKEQHLQTEAHTPPIHTAPMRSVQNTRKDEVKVEFNSVYGEEIELKLL